MCSEPFNDDGTWRSDVFYNTLGESFVPIALEAASGADPNVAVPAALKSGELKLSCTDPDNPRNWPRNMFFWRGNVLGASGKGHEYFLKQFLLTGQKDKASLEMCTYSIHTRLCPPAR